MQPFNISMQRFNLPFKHGFLGRQDNIRIFHKERFVEDCRRGAVRSRLLDTPDQQIKDI